MLNIGDSIFRFAYDIDTNKITKQKYKVAKRTQGLSQKMYQLEYRKSKIEVSEYELELLYVHPDTENFMLYTEADLEKLEFLADVLEYMDEALADLHERRLECHALCLELELTNRNRSKPARSNVAKFKPKTKGENSEASNIIYLFGKDKPETE